MWHALSLWLKNMIKTYMWGHKEVGESLSDLNLSFSILYLKNEKSGESEALKRDPAPQNSDVR